MKRFAFAPLALAAAFAGAPVAAQAADLSYNYVQALYEDVNIDTGAGSADGSAFGLAGSYGVTDILFVNASYSSADYNHGLKESGWSAGAGVHLPVNQAADFIISAALGNDEVKTPFGKDNSDFYAAGVALRGRVAPALELEGGIDFIDYDQGGNDTVYSLAGLYEVTPQIGVGLRYTTMDNADTFGVLGRLDF